MTPNWKSVREETTKYLQDLIRIDTTNPPGNEIQAAEYLAGVFKREGIAPTVLESAPGRGNIVARIKGDGRAAPLLLMAHIDVVPVEADKWQHPPFGGDIADGFLWGRGTLDTKELVAMELMLMLLLKREGKSLARDIIFMANADEEAGGRMGAGWMVEHHRDLIQAEYAINEGGGMSFDVLGKRFFTVQTGEKGTARFVMRARGRPGHAAQPHSDNAVVKLADAIQKIGAAEFPLHVTKTVHDFFQGIADNVDQEYRPGILALLDAKTHRDAIKGFDDGLRPMVNAMLHNTVTPTMLDAGTKINVIPSVAEAQCDTRLIPGQSKDDFLRELRAVIGKNMEIEIADNYRMGRESDHHTPLFDTITRVLGRHEPKSSVLPYLVTGATDARWVTQLGTKVYGFCPMIASTSELDRVHAHNERISIDNLEFGTRVLYEVVTEFATKI